LFDVLNSAIVMTYKAKEEVNVRPSFEFLMDDDLAIFFELASLASNIRLEVFGVLDSFLSFMKTCDEKKTHDMLALMFDPRFKSLCVLSSYVGKKQGVSIVEEYDRRTLYPMLVKLCNHLHPIVDGGFGSTNQDANQDYGLDIFQMMNNNKEIVKEIVIRELLDFRRFHVDLKEIKNPLQWWEKHESRFSIVAFLAWQIRGITGAQIETTHIFSLTGNLNQS